MKIWILTVNELGPEPSITYSSYRTPRTERKNEYYASRESAERRRDQIYDGVKSLTGFIDNMEVVIKEVKVEP